MDHAIEAHLKSVNKYWKDGIPGGKFSQQDRITQVRLIPEEANIRGPLKPEEYEHFCEKPVQVFGHIRRVRPFSRVRLSSPDKRGLQLGMSDSEQMFTEVALPRDEWTLRPVCGVLKQSPMFILPSSSSSPLKHTRPIFPSIDKLQIDMAASNTNPVLCHRENPRPPTGKFIRGTAAKKNNMQSSPILSGIQWTNQNTDDSIKDSKELTIETNNRTVSLLQSVSADTQQQRFNEYTYMIAPLIGEQHIAGDVHLNYPVAKSKSIARRRKDKQIELQREHHRIYTEGMDRVIMLKTAENVAVRVPSTSSSSRMNKAQKELEILLARLSDDYNAQKAQEKSQLILQHFDSISHFDSLSSDGHHNYCS